MNVQDADGNGDGGAFVATQLGHVLDEYFQAETTYKDKESGGNGPKSEWFLKSHDAALVFESQVLSNFSGQQESKRQEDSRPTGGAYIYSSQRYNVFYKDAKDVSVFQINRRPVPKQ